MNARRSPLKSVQSLKQQPWHHNVPELMDTRSVILPYGATGRLFP